MAQENAVTRYQKKTLIRRSFNLNKNTDVEMIEHLEKIENFQGYVKSLIQQDMENEKKARA